LLGRLFWRESAEEAFAGGLQYIKALLQVGSNLVFEYAPKVLFHLGRAPPSVLRAGASFVRGGLICIPDVVGRLPGAVRLPLEDVEVF
jgi:hypothetical protein